MGQIPQCPFSGRQNMVRIFTAFFIMAFLASCGGTPYSSNNAAGIRASASSQTLYALAQSHPPVARQDAKKRRVHVVDVSKPSPIAACLQTSNSAVCRFSTTRSASKICVSLTRHQTSGSGGNGKSSGPKRAVCAPNPIWGYALGRPSVVAVVQ